MTEWMQDYVKQLQHSREVTMGITNEHATTSLLSAENKLAEVSVFLFIMCVNLCSKDYMCLCVPMYIRLLHQERNSKQLTTETTDLEHLQETHSSSNYFSITFLVIFQSHLC